MKLNLSFPDCFFNIPATTLPWQIKKRVCVTSLIFLDKIFVNTSTINSSTSNSLYRIIKKLYTNSHRCLQIQRLYWSCNSNLNFKLFVHTILITYSIFSAETKCNHCDEKINIEYFFKLNVRRNH